MCKITFLLLTLSLLPNLAWSVLTYTVDASVPSSSSPVFKELKDTIPSVRDPSGYISDNITIILKSTTVGIDQTLPNFSINGGTGGVDIVYEDADFQVSSPSDCDLLPSILLSGSSSNSVLPVSNIDYFSITGVTLKVVSDTYSNSISNVRNVTFRNICMLNSNPTSVTNLNYLLQFYSITLLNFTNMVMLHDSSGMMYIWSSNIAIQSWKLVVYKAAVNYPMVYIVDDTTKDHNVTVTDFTITCSDWDIRPATQTIYIQDGALVNITDVHISNCFFGRHVTRNCLFSLRDIHTLILQQLTFENMKLDLIADKSSNGFLQLRNHKILFISSVLYKNVTTLSIPNDSVGNNIGFGYISFYYNAAFEAISAIVEHIMLLNSHVAGKGSIHYVFSLDEKTKLIPVKHNNFSIINSTFDVSMGFEIQPQRFETKQDISSVTFYSLNNFQVINCSFYETQLFTFVTQNFDRTAYLLDVFGFEITNFTLIGNTFTSTGIYNPIELLGAQFRINNLTALNNTLIGCIFLTVSLRLSTFALVNSTINQLNLDNGAYFIGYTTDTKYNLPEEGFYQDKKYIVETRPFSIINSTFSNIVLLRGSYLIRSNSPMIIFANNGFSGISSTESNLIVFGKYKPPTIKPPGYAYNISLWAEEKIFENYSPVLETFRSVRDLITANNPSNEISVFFIGFQNNSFQNITSTNEKYIISFTDLTIDTNSISYFNTSFTDVKIITSQDFSIFAFSEINRVYFANLSCFNISGTGRVVGVSSTSIAKLSLDLLSFDMMTEVSSFQIVSSICANTTITNGISKNILLHGPWIDINCYTQSSQITFAQNSFSNISVTAIVGELTPINFLLMKVQQAASGSVPAVSFTDNEFKDITLYKPDQGFAQDVYSSQMISLALSDSIVTLTQNVFENLSNYPNDNILTVSALNISFVNCFFRNLTHHELLGAIYLVFNNLVVNGTIFQENTGKNDNGGGLMTLLNPNAGVTSLNVTIENCTFTRNSATKASLIQIQETSLNLSLKDSILMDNYAVSGGIIFLDRLYESVISLSNVTFQLLYSSYANVYIYTGFEINEAQAKVDIQMDNCNLKVNGPFAGDLISVNKSEKTNLRINNFTYAPSPNNQSVASNLVFSLNPNYELQQGNPSYSILNANRINAAIYNLSVQHINIDRKPLFIMECMRKDDENIYFGTLTLASSAFEYMTNTESLISMTPQNLQSTDTCQIYVSVTDSWFQNISGVNIDGAIIRNRVYQIGNSSDTSSSTIQNTAINLTNNNFQEISARSGGIYYSPRLFKNSAVLVLNNSFVNLNVTLNGGAFYVEPVILQQEQTSSTANTRRILSTTDLSLVESYAFEDNTFHTVTTQNGGVFYSSAPNGKDSMIILQNNKFTDIQAYQRGAILYLNNHTVTANLNQFISADAGISGTIIYSSSAQYDTQQFVASNTLSQNITSSSLQPLSFGPNYLDVQLIAPDSAPIEIIYCNTSDSTYCNSLQGLDSNSKFLVKNISTYSMKEISIITTLMYQNGSEFKKVIDTKDSVSAVEFTFKGEFVDSKKTQSCSESVCNLILDDLNLVGLADSLIDVFVSYSSINLKTNTDYKAAVNFTIQLRSCIAGEINDTARKSCEYCTGGSYSVSPSDKECSPCPPGGSCLGGAYINLDPGYWRLSIHSSSVIPCNDSGARCLGGYEANCSEEFTGPVCAQCNTDNGYLPVGKSKCSKCPSKSQILVTAVFVYIGMLAYQIFVISTTLKDNTKTYQASLESSETPPLQVGAYIVLLTTYSQISSVISKLGIGYISQMFGVSNAVGNPNQQASFSLECIYYLDTTDPFNTFKFKIIFFIFSPLVKLCFIVLGELIRAIIKRKDTDKKKNALVRIGVAAVVLIMLEQPGIIGVICEYLSCDYLDPTDEQTFVTTVPNINCGTEEYESFRNMVVVPGLVVWGFVIPLVIFLFLYKNRKVLGTSEMARKIFGSLYSNYSQKAYYWGLVIMIFKICMFILDSVLTISLAQREAIFLLVIHLYFQFYQHTSPYIHEDLIKTEKYMMAAFKWTLSLILLKEVMDIEEGSLLDNFVTLIIAAINGLFVGHVLLKLLAEYIKKIGEVFKKMKAWYSKKKSQKTRKFSIQRAKFDNTMEHTVTISPEQQIK